MATRPINFRIELDLAEAFKTSTKEQLRIAGKGFQNIVKAYKSELGNKTGLRNVNQALAENMRDEVVQAYQSNVLAYAVPSYRRGKKRFPKALGEALSSSTMAGGTSEGINFIDLGLLNRKAVFWARLNFGTEGRGEPQHNFARPRARVQFGANQGFSLSLPDDPRPAFRIPEFPTGGTNKGLGYFNPAGQFFPGKTKNKANTKIRRGDFTKGIGARRFLDAGLVALARDFKPFYEEYVNDVTRRMQSRIAKEK